MNGGQGVKVICAVLFLSALHLKRPGDVSASPGRLHPAVYNVAGNFYIL